MSYEDPLFYHPSALHMASEPSLNISGSESSSLTQSILSDPSGIHVAAHESGSFVVPRLLVIPPQETDLSTQINAELSNIPSTLCPISQETMEDPVVDREGFSYERKNIVRWLKTHPTSPVTRRRMRASELRPNRALKDMIQELHKMTETKADSRTNDATTSKHPDSNPVEECGDPIGVHINSDPVGVHIDELL